MQVSRSHRTRHFDTEASVPSQASPSDVIRYVRSPATWPKWQSEIVAVDGSGTVREGDVVDGDARLLGFDVTGRSSVVKVTGDAFEEDVIVGVRMRVSYAVSPTASGSTITHRIQADLPSGIAGSVLSFLLSLRLKRMQRNLLAALSHQAARGQADVGSS